ncbi:MAG: pyridoxal-phosphate dependent enzyme [Planctomycetota bacterium]|jgi:threonine synthase|nr:pyridoxal-phosphate dependent enzyme [Planctomycetota bacterium]MDP6989735.1 pyridoxal-phosphate dependent enzyme [Planctomycetota bacterium]
MNLGGRVVCGGCGTPAPDGADLPTRCTAAREADDVDHVLVRELDLEGTRFPFDGDGSPWVRYRELLYAWRAARRAGAADEAWCDAAAELDRRLEATGIGGAWPTPLAPRPKLAAALGRGELWVKDETTGVGGTHKARHLVPLALHRLALAPPKPPRLAVASCGNAALAAAGLARACGWPLEAHVPADIAPSVAARLEDLGARLVRCPRDPTPGDPCRRSFLAALDEGALPFSCQGDAHGLAIEGGASLVWEVVSERGLGAPPLDHVVVQVGGGALASAVLTGFRDALALGAIGRLPRVHCVQGAGCAPLAAAWERLRESGDLDPGGIAAARRRRGEVMVPWPTTPAGAAGGLLDDETYDWAALVAGMAETGGAPLVVSDDELVGACEAAAAHAGVSVDPSGAAGLAGWARLCAEGAIGAAERSLVLFTGAPR